MLIEPNSDCHDSTQNKLSKLLKQRELLNKTILTMIPESEPINRQLIPPMVETFQTTYKNELNSGINSHELLIKWNKILEFTDLEASKTDPNVFIACYYLLNEDTFSNKYFTYVIAKALRKKIGTYDTIMPISTVPDNKFLMLSYYTPNGELIDSNKFKQLVQNYINTIQFMNTMPNPDTGPFNVKDYSHPLISYHKAQKFYKLFDDNKDSLVDTTKNNLYIKIQNGVIGSKKPVPSKIIGQIPIDINCQTPILSLMEFSRDLLGDEETPDEKRFLFRGLDVGRLCPPDC